MLYMNPRDPNHSRNLSKAVESSYRAIEPFRNLSKGLVQEYVGSGYTGGDRAKDSYANLMNQAVDAYMMALASNRPRIKITTQHPQLRGFARHFETAVNNLIKEINLEATIREWVLNAFFSVGIIKVHLADSPLVEIEHDIWMDPGIPFASNVGLDNWVHDTSVPTAGQCKFFGDMYRIPFSDLEAGIESGLYEEAAKEIQPDRGKPNDGIRTEDLSREFEVNPEDFEPMVDLADIYIPRTGMIYTFEVTNRHHFQIKGPPIAEMEWSGTEQGPYVMLGFNDVPDNIMPASPADQLSTLSRLVNRLLRKQSRQASRQKDVTAYTPGGAESAKRIQRSSDGELIEVQSPDEVTQLKLGGADANNQAFVGNAIDLFDRMAGNLPVMLGLGQSADTLGQEQIIRASASRKETQMQIRVIEGVVKVVKELGLLLWEDQFKVIPAAVQVEGNESYQVDSTWTPEDREGSFLDYNFEIDVYSMAYRTPSQRANSVSQVVTQIFAPLAPMLQEQGGSIDLAKLAEMYAEMTSEPRINEIISFGNQGTQEQGPSGNLPSKPPVTSRNYTRTNLNPDTDSFSQSNEANPWGQMAAG